MDELQRTKFILHLDELIDKHGWALQGIFAAEGDDSTPWLYTVGLGLKDRPEMIISGLPSQAGGTILNDVAAMSLGDAPPQPGTLISGVLTGGYKLAVTTVARPREGDWFNVGWSWANSRHRDFDSHGVVQLVWPTTDYNFPATTSKSQVLLGPAWWSDA